MGRRVDKITVTMEVYIEFEGSHTSTFSYEPKDDDPLVALACDKNDQLQWAAVRKSPDAGEVL